MGVHPGLIATLKTFSPKGTKVLLQTPTYNGFYGDLTASQTLAEEVPLKIVNGKYAMDFEQFEKQISVDTNSFILCNPQNPTGNCWSAEDMLRIGEICLKHRVVVLADEIHCDFVSKGQKYTPFASLPNKDVVNNSITFKAASKSFGLAAHKIAWFYTTNAEYLGRIKVNHRAELNTLGIVANQGALHAGRRRVVEPGRRIHRRQQRLRGELHQPQHPDDQGLQAPGDVPDVAGHDRRRREDRHEGDGRTAQPDQGRRCAGPQGGADAGTLGGQVPKVHMNQGASYGKGGENHVRMNIATSRKTLEKALGNLANALKPAALSSAL